MQKTEGVCESTLRFLFHGLTLRRTCFVRCDQNATVERGAHDIGVVFGLVEDVAAITADVTPPGTRVNAGAEIVAVGSGVVVDVSGVVENVASNRAAEGAAK